MGLLENDHFLTELTKMFTKSKSSGSVSITMKRWDGHTKPKPKSADAAAAQKTDHHQEYKCLFRAKLGNKKISTVSWMKDIGYGPLKVRMDMDENFLRVNPKEVNKFQLAYANLMKLNIDNLKKRDRKTDKDNKKSATVARAAKSDH